MEMRAQSRALGILNEEAVTAKGISAPSITVFPSTAYIGNIAPGITDETLEHILQALTTSTSTSNGNGNKKASILSSKRVTLPGLKRWKRVQGADGQPRPFGFAEFENAQGVARAVRLLNGFSLLRLPLNVKVDAGTGHAVEVYLGELVQELRENATDNSSSSGSSGSLLLRDYLMRQDGEALDAMALVISERGLTASVETLRDLQRRLPSLYGDRNSPEVQGGKQAKASDTGGAPSKSAPKKSQAAGNNGVEKRRSVVKDAMEAESLRDRERQWEAEESRIQRHAQQESVMIAERDRVIAERLAEAMKQLLNKEVSLVEDEADRLDRALSSSTFHSFVSSKGNWESTRRAAVAAERKADAEAQAAESARRTHRESVRAKWSALLEESRRLSRAHLQHLQQQHQIQAASSGGKPGTSSTPAAAVDALRKIMPEEERAEELKQLRAMPVPASRDIPTRQRQLAALIPCARPLLLRTAIPWHRWAGSDRRWSGLVEMLLARFSLLHSQTTRQTSGAIIGGEEGKDDPTPQLPPNLHSAIVEFAMALREAIMREGASTTTSNYSSPNSPESFNARMWKRCEEFLWRHFRDFIPLSSAANAKDAAAAATESGGSVSWDILLDRAATKLFRRWAFEAECEALRLIPAYL